MGVIRLLGSIIWAVALGVLCYQISDGTQLERWNLHNLSWFDVIGMLAIIGFLQSSFALQFFFAMLKDESNREYYDVYKDSQGREIRREINGDAKMSGCFFTFMIGLLLSVLLSAFLSPVFFVINIGSFLWYSLSETRSRWLLFFLIPLLVFGVAYGSYKAYCIIDKHVSTVEACKQKRMLEENARFSSAPRQKEKVKVSCNRCNGAGSVMTRRNCIKCYGTGVKQIRQRGSRQRVKVPCNSCNGSRYKTVQSRCFDCMGKGYSIESR